MNVTSSKMSRTTAKLGLVVLALALAVCGVLVGADPELRLAARLGVAGVLVLAAIASMVKALVFETDAQVRPRTAGSGSRS